MDDTPIHLPCMNQKFLKPLNLPSITEVLSLPYGVSGIILRISRLCTTFFIAGIEAPLNQLKNYKTTYF